MEAREQGGEGTRTSLFSFPRLHYLTAWNRLPRAEIGRRSFIRRAAAAWKTFPDVIKQHDNPKTFKVNLKQ